MLTDKYNGMELSEKFYHEIVAPILQEQFPDVPYAAGLLGPGSEVLGFDDVMSQDHHWGVRMLLFLQDSDHNNLKTEIREVLSENLPYTFEGVPVHWSQPDPEDSNNQFPREITEGLVNHRVEIYSVNSFLQQFLGISFPQAHVLTDLEWLALSEQRLLEFTSGKVFYDSVGELTKARKLLSYYPENVQVYCILAEWNNIFQEMAFIGRTGYVSDDLGSRVITAKLVKLGMKLLFLVNRRYVPYPKWFGSAFELLNHAEVVKPHLERALKTDAWKDRENHLVDALLEIAKAHWLEGVVEEVEISKDVFFSRSFIIPDVKNIQKALKLKLKPPFDEFRYHLGSLTTIIENTDIICSSELVNKLLNFTKT